MFFSIKKNMSLLKTLLCLTILLNVCIAVIQASKIRTATVIRSSISSNRIRKRRLRHKYPNKQIKHKNVCHDLRDTCNDIGTIPGKCNDRWIQSHCPVTCNTCSQLVQIIPKKNMFNPIQTTKNDSHNTKVTIIDSFSGGTNQRSGVPQRIPEYYQDNPLYINDAYEPIRYAKAYLQTIDNNSTFAPIQQRCKNLHENCLTLALDGQCHTDSTIQCGPLCFTCEQLHTSAQCPMPHMNDVKNALYPGDVNRMFERIVSDPVLMDQYNITILSQPDKDDADVPTSFDIQNESSVDEYMKIVESQKGGPWIISIDNFVNDTEIESLLRWGTALGFHRSYSGFHYDTLKENDTVAYPITKERTSSQAWCEGLCMMDPIILSLNERIMNLTKVSTRNYEQIQLLQYKYGQYNTEHIDYNEIEYDTAQGVRIVTVFIYLNDIVYGGGTRFTYVNVTVQPKRGRLVIWPNVLNNKPHYPDGRTIHEGMSIDSIVETKYAANVWIHQRPLPTTNCLGSVVK